MSNWSQDMALMPTGKLVLVKQEMTGVCLRQRNEDGDFYDEHWNFDDSELAITEWCEIPD